MVAHMRRFTRLTNAFSKKIENHAYAVALHMTEFPDPSRGASDTTSIPRLLKLTMPVSLLAPPSLAIPLS